LLLRGLPASGEATTSAAAPSLMLEALPAVMVPSGPNAGLSASSEPPGSIKMRNWQAERAKYPEVALFPREVG
jgi:hypothetical protein